MRTYGKRSLRGRSSSPIFPSNRAHTEPSDLDHRHFDEFMRSKKNLHDIDVDAESVVSDLADLLGLDEQQSSAKSSPLTPPPGTYLRWIRSSLHT